MTKQLRISVLVFCFFLGIAYAPLYANNPEGENLFKTVCKACHTLDMRLVGPPLRGITERLPEDWLIKFIKSSQTVIKSGDEYANALFLEYNQIPMPDPNLTDDEIKSILAYIKSESQPKTGEAKGAIVRPEMPTKKVTKPLRFGDVAFWLPYTITVLLIIGFLYHLTEVTILLEGEEEN